MDEDQEIRRTPILTKKQLQRWQKSLLEVFDHLLLEFGMLSMPVAPFTSGMEKTRNCVPFCCTHERRRPSFGVHN